MAYSVNRAYGNMVVLQRTRAAEQPHILLVLILERENQKL